eukprot:4062138-Alexandrium_andersonii.AAC.1
MPADRVPPSPLSYAAPIPFRYTVPVYVSRPSAPLLDSHPPSRRPSHAPSLDNQSSGSRRPRPWVLFARPPHHVAIDPMSAATSEYWIGCLPALQDLTLDGQPGLSLRSHL